MVFTSAMMQYRKCLWSDMLNKDAYHARYDSRLRGRDILVSFSKLKNSTYISKLTELWVVGSEEIAAQLHYLHYKHYKL